MIRFAISQILRKHLGNLQPGARMMTMSSFRVAIPRLRDTPSERACPREPHPAPSGRATSPRSVGAPPGPNARNCAAPASVAARARLHNFTP